MQKISSYLYPNRITLLADLASFNVEFTSVYQRHLKIYNGIDNTIEFDIKNADQKRIELVTNSVLSQLEMNVMDAAGNALPNSPYALTPTLVKGIATVTIPQEDLVDLTDQYLKYSVTGLKSGRDTILYADTRFGAVGTIELVGDAMPTFRDAKVYDTFTGEIDLIGHVINHTSAIPAKFYEAVPTTELTFTINMTGFIGNVWIEGTKNDTISVNSFLNASKLVEFIYDENNLGDVATVTLPVGEFSYFRVYYRGDDPLNPTGTVDKVTVE
jgi:hypothetical protein